MSQLPEGTLTKGNYSIFSFISFPPRRNILDEGTGWRFDTCFKIPFALYKSSKCIQIILEKVNKVFSDSRVPITEGSELWQRHLGTVIG